ncbi:transcription factor 23 [Neosynchiropus ocellatus]
MAVSPLEGLRSIAVDRQLVTERPQPFTSPAPRLRQRASARSSREQKKWSACGPKRAVAPTRARCQHAPESAARERMRVRNMRQAFHSLQAALPSVPPDTKLSKLDILVLAINYIAHLTETLDQDRRLVEPTHSSRAGYLHPVKKWPMRSLLYCGSVGKLLSVTETPAAAGWDGTRLRSRTTYLDAE